MTIHLLWQAVQVVFWVALFCAVAGLPWYFSFQEYDRDYSPRFLVKLALWASIAWCAIAIAAGFIFLFTEIDKADDAAHRWEGGSGPDTHCEFEVRTEMRNKIAQQITYTVCD